LIPERAPSHSKIMTRNEKDWDKSEIVPSDAINKKIFEIRGCKVLLDSDLAALYGVETKVFNQSVSRNIRRFPEDFRFQLTRREYQNLRSQIVTSSSKLYGGRRYPPYVFTEQGVAMLSGVLNSDRAIEVNIGIMRAFVKMRQMISSKEEIKEKLAEIENELGNHNRHFEKVFAALRLLMEPDSKKREQIGYIRK